MSRATTHQRIAKNKLYLRERRARLKSQGLCVWCGQVPHLQGRTRCGACSSTANRASRERLQRIRPGLMALGVCGICLQRLAIPGQVRCGACAEAAVEQTAARRARRKELG